MRATVRRARRSQVRILLGWGGALLLLLGLTAVVWNWTHSKAGEQDYRFVVEASRRGSLSATVVATGSLRARDQVEVGAELSGRIAKVHVDFNDQVEARQVLCELDAVSWNAAVKQARAQLGVARASLRSAQIVREEAKKQAQRSESLALASIVSTQQLESDRAANKRAAAAVALSSSQVALAQAGLDSAEDSLSRTRVRSPISGIVLSRSVEPGQTVAASFQAPVLFTLARDLTQMELRIQIDEADIGMVAERQPASFVVDAYPQRVFEAQLTSIHNIASVENNVVTYEALLRVGNDDLALRPGMTATVTIVTAKRSHALLVPNAALRFVPPSALAERPSSGPPSPFGRRRATGKARAKKTEPSGPKVWVKEAQQPPRPVSVKTGLSDGEWTEVLAGNLKADQPLLIDAMLGGR